VASEINIENKAIISCYIGEEIIYIFEELVYYPEQEGIGDSLCYNWS
jgi:hypothetical protein